MLRGDAIEMDDGTVVRNWPRLTANVQLSGPGGLDQGTVENLSWYDLYAIRKSADDTRALVFHRHKQYVLDQEQGSGVSVVGLRDSSMRQGVQQSFQVASPGPVEIIDIPIHRVGSPNGRIWMQIEDASGAVLATSDKLRINTLAQSISDFNMRFVFRDPATLLANTTYYASLYGDFAMDGGNYVRWYCGAGDTYGRGAPRTFDGTSWTQWNANDMALRVYVTRDTPFSLLTGYDQKALLGFYYTSDLFDPTVCIDRKEHWLVRSTGDVPGGGATRGQIEGFTCNMPSIRDSWIVFPHGVNVSAHIAVQKAAAGRVLVAGVPEGFGRSFDDFDGSVTGHVKTAGDYVHAGQVYTEYGGLYVCTEGAGSATVMVPNWEW